MNYTCTDRYYMYVQIYKYPYGGGARMECDCFKYMSINSFVIQY